LQLKHFLAAGAFALATVATLPAAAQNCVGFVDMPLSDPVIAAFCPSVEWLKNRAITTGCGDGTTYCPDSVVTRLSMAAFMKRLGDALTPAFLRKRDTALGALNFSGTGQTGICPTDAVSITGYPRTAIVRGLMNLFTPDGGMDIKAWAVYSIDGGTNWLTPATNDGLAYGTLYAGQTPPNDLSLHPMNVIELAVGNSYRFALAAARTAGTGAIANAYCENLVQLVNRLGTSSPLDTAPDPGPHGRGN
jgi:hypothetical protein